MKKQKELAKRVHCLFVVPDANQENAIGIDLQEALCHGFASKNHWEVIKESKASLFSNDEFQPYIYQKLIDICCRSVKKEYDILLIASKACLEIPNEYLKQAIDWLTEQGIEVWSVTDGKMSSSI